MLDRIPPSIILQADAEWESMSLMDAAYVMSDFAVGAIDVLRHERKYVDSDLYPFCLSEWLRQILDGESQPWHRPEIIVERISEASPAHEAWRKAMLRFAEDFVLRERPRVTIRSEWISDRIEELAEKMEQEDAGA